MAYTMGYTMDTPRLTPYGKHCKTTAVLLAELALPLLYLHTIMQIIED